MSSRAPSSDGGGSSIPSGSLADIQTEGTYFIGRYRVVDEIGIGGMASVHLARMDGPGEFQKWVAIKKIHAHLVEDESFVEMFLDEARVAARISHPNVATVFDVGTHANTYWLAMEYLHGEPLREVMRRTEELGTAMPPEIACRVIADAAEGLHAAHELLGKNGEKLNVVHRDVTPHNLFVTYEGVTKVVDFGIAKFSSRMSHTRAGTLKGKLAYMSPEQVHGEGIDRRTDIFALGVVLWELTTGQRLFRMENDLDTLAKVQECAVPRPSTLIRGYPVDLEKIVMKALAKNRGERFRTTREFSRALQSLLMRRGLFIASDEVAAYTHSIFAERIQKRETHLRWAAEVTQTINVDQLLSSAKLGPEFTSSEVQTSEPRRSPPPAAGAPPRPLPAAGLPMQPVRAGGPVPATDHVKATAPRTVTARPPAGPALGAGPKPPGRAPAPPRPAAGVPAPTVEPHPADGDGPTIQSPPMSEEDFAHGVIEPPTLMEPSSRKRLRPSDGAHPSREVLDANAFEDDDDDDDDQAQTMIAHGPSSAGEDRGSVPSTARVVNLTSPMAQPAPLPFGPPPPGYVAAPTFTGEVPFASEPMPMSGDATVGMPFTAVRPYDPNAYGGPSRHPAERFGQPLAPFGGEPVHPGQFASRTVPPQLGRDNRTMTAQRFKRRPPMWVVAAISCCLALLIAGVVFVIVSTTGGRTSRAPENTRAASTGADPFNAARTAFNGALNAPSAAPPPTAPSIAPTPDDTDPSAAATAAPPTTEAAPDAPAPDAVPTPRAAAPQAVQAATKKVASSAPGALTVVCIPKCDQIIDNGTSLGPGHLFNRSVPSGRHSLVLSAPNGVKKKLTVEVAPNQTKEVRLSMDR